MDDLPTVAVGKLDGHEGPVTSVRFVPSSSDGAATSGSTVPTVPTTATPKKGYCLTAGHDRLIKLWNPFRIDPAESEGSSSNERKHRRKRPRKTIDGKNEGSDKHIATVDYNDLPSCLEIQTYKFFAHDISAINSCMTSPSSSSSTSSHDTLLAASKNNFVVADLVTNSVIRRMGSAHHTGRINDICAFDNLSGGNGGGGGSQLYITASYDATVAIWDARARNNHQPIQILHDATDSVQCVLVGDGNGKNGGPAIIRTGSVDGIVRTYDIRRGTMTLDSMGDGSAIDSKSKFSSMGPKPTSSSSSSSPITSMTMTHDGQCLAVNCLDGTIRLIDVESGELMNTYSGSHTSESYGLDVAVLASDTTIATGSEDGSCVLYDLVSARPVRRLPGNTSVTPVRTTQPTILPPPPRRPTCNVAAHPKHNSVLITASYDNSVIVWANDSTLWDQQFE